MSFVSFKVIQGVLECDSVAEKGCQGTDKHVRDASSQPAPESETLAAALHYQDDEWIRQHGQAAGYDWGFSYWYFGCDETLIFCILSTIKLFRNIT